MKKIKQSLLSLILVAAILLCLCPMPFAQAVGIDYGAQAYQYLEGLVALGGRLANTATEVSAAAYVQKSFEDMGYKTTVQPFVYSTTRRSQNVIAVKKAVNSQGQIIIGAHYDSVSRQGSVGCDDNASGTSVLLGTAAMVKSMENLKYDIVFIAFGAEEAGLKGSQYYAENMTQAEVDSTHCMINIDSVGGGDFMYVYGNADNNRGWVRDALLSVAAGKGIQMGTSPGKEAGSDYEYGDIGDFSDHVYFRRRGIPFAYCEATNWVLDPVSGEKQTVAFGTIMHTKQDTLVFLNENFPGRVLSHLDAYINVIGSFVAGEAAGTPIASLSNVSSMAVKKGKTAALPLTVEPAAHNGALTYVVQNPSVARVDANGMVLGCKQGMTLVTVTSPEGLQTRILVFVNA